MKKKNQIKLDLNCELLQVSIFVKKKSSMTTSNTLKKTTIQCDGNTLADSLNAINKNQQYLKRRYTLYNNQQENFKVNDFVSFSRPY